MYHPSHPEPGNANTYAAEFVALLEALGVVLNGDRQQSVRCWRHADRRPSLSVHPARCVWHCHSCGESGGLRELRAAAGVVTPERAESVSRVALLARFARLAAPGADPLALVPAAAVDELRAATGRHKRDRVLSDNVARVLAAIHQRMTASGFTAGVPFSALDASRDGIPPALWQHLVALPLKSLGGRPLVAALGVDVVLGESGRCARRFRGTGKAGAFRSTLVTLRHCEYSGPGGSEGVLVPGTSLRGIHTPSLGAGPDATRAASLAASVPKSTGQTLHRRRSVALLLADLALATSVVPESDGRTTRTGTRTLAELVAQYGARVRRTVRAAAALGWVDVVRLVDSSRDGLVFLTPAGAERLTLDLDRAALFRNDRADRIAAAWSTRQQTLRVTASERARAHARRRLDELAPWHPFGDGLVRHALTGAVIPRDSLRG